MVDRPLTEEQDDLLAKFAWAGFRDEERVRPTDLGGRNGSGPSAMLAHLERRGLVQSRSRSHSVRESKFAHIPAWTC